MLLFVDSLVVLGLATVSLGTIHETDGVQVRSFWLQNTGQQSVVLQQGYTSCGCTTIDFAKAAAVGPGDSTQVTLRFNPRGKGGEFHEVGTIVYGADKKRVQLTLTGQCITSEETLMQQFPIRISDQLRLSANRLDLGVMRLGESKERGVVVLHRDDNNRKERIPIVFRVDEKHAKGLHHIDHPLTVVTKTGRQVVHVTLDVMIK